MKTAASYVIIAALGVFCQIGFCDDNAQSPNFIVILCDNLGYGDIGCYGSNLHRTPRIDQMAREGISLTSFYSTSGVCTPSRASLMTGCYPRRVGLDVTDPDGAVLRPVSPNGLHPDEVTIAEVLKQKNYATACVGKWHLGDQPPFLPTRQGFDEYFGIPYSDDMTAREGKNWPALPLMDGEQVIEAPVDRDMLTKRYTERAIDFITRHQKQPFFLYLPHAMPGSTKTPYVSKRFQGKSANGPWGDSVEEIDWSTGEILDALKRLNLDKNTLVVWTSDNGAPRRNPPQGSNAPLGGWGYTTMEGGMRVPCIVRWPDKIPAGAKSDAISTTMDLLPTFAGLADIELSQDQEIDGHDIWSVLFSSAEAQTPYEALYYYHRDQLHAVRSGKWKLHLALKAKQINLQGKSQASKARLYDLDTDIGETTSVVDKHPEVVARLAGLAEAVRKILGDGNQLGTGQRNVGRVESPQPQRLP